jgi:hypothetical protein
VIQDEGRRPREATRPAAVTVTNCPEKVDLRTKKEKKSMFNGIFSGRRAARLAPRQTSQRERRPSLLGGR